ncbi:MULTISPECIES: glycine-rich domain-containing protein [unclassified Janthinobacterium]|uniref:glycine-rich domain-containing protein n=1 Tax=unclassified Janthinobacterium TaxID=2610881 RepID=UPI00034617E4|nr:MULTISPECIES: hypothetical protein [unclassified Janthinobacterium]MEC5162920.1 hypothetical protein [Janthinobacterium sp. CG_S6]
MNSNDNFQAIANLDLDPIKVKLMHQESGEGWSLEKVNAVEFEYRRFLHLMKIFPSEATAPLFDVDTFWHYHILDTMKYAVDCEEVFGYFLHHFPYVGLRGEADLEAHQRVGERMKELYEQTFGEDYIRSAAAMEAAGAPETAFSSAATTTAFSSRAPAVAFSSRAPAVAFSSAAVASAKTAFSSAAVKTAFSSRAPATAFSSAAVQTTAFSSAAVSTAFSSASVKTAFSSRAPATAFSSAAVTAEQTRFYTERPVLSKQR